MDVIPYTVEVRKDTGLYNAKLGIWLFLASEVMLFGALFSSYILLRIGHPSWPEGSDILNIPLGTVNTIVLISSSVSMVLAWAALKEKDFVKSRKMLLITLVCSIVFMVIKSFEYSAKFSHGLFPSTNTFMAVYFTLTGLHALHIIGGVVVLAYHYFRGHVLWEKEPQQYTNRLEIAGLYWHFVDLVWIFLFPVLYLL